jgi:hypothetical protein
LKFLDINFDVNCFLCSWNALFPAAILSLISSSIELSVSLHVSANGKGLYQTRRYEIVYKVNNIVGKEAFFLHVWETFAIVEEARWYLEGFFLGLGIVEGFGG